MSHTLSDFYGKKIALLLHYRNENGEPAAALIKGTGFFQNGFLHLHRGSIVAPMPLPLKVVWRALRADAAVKDILGDVDFVMEARVHELPLLNKEDGTFLKSA